MSEVIICGIQNKSESKAFPHCGVPLDMQLVMNEEKIFKESLKTIGNDPATI